MDLPDTWAIAQVLYAASALATLGIAWGIRQSQQPPHERRVLRGSLLALALHYGSATVDAALQGQLDGRGSFTLWTATAQFFLITFWVLLVLFLVHVIRGVLGPVVNASRVTLPAWLVVFGNAVAVAYGFIAGYARTDGDVVLPEDLRAPTVYAALVAGLSLALHPAYDALPDGHRTRWTRWLSGHAFRWRMAVMSSPTGERRADMKVLFSIYGTALLLIAITFLVNETAQWTSPRVALVTMCRVLVLPSILGLMYFQARVLVFDVIVKRTITFAAITVAVTLVWLVGVDVADLRPSSGAPLVCAAAVLLVYATGTLLQRVDPWLDRQLFRRPRYDAELRGIVDLMARAETVSSLQAVVTRELSRVFARTSIDFASEPVGGSAFTAEVGATGERRGYLSFGQPPRGQYFRSEEHRFIQQVAAHFSARLASFDVQEARVQATEAEWKALRAQINPHFLFNALNTLAEMAAGHSAVERTVLNLSHVCRYALTSSERGQVPLYAEVEAVRAYLEVERERFDERLRVSIDVSPDAAHEMIPPMLIQPIVENAVKHGIGQKIAGGTVSVTADARNGMLRIVVGDDGVGFDPAEASTGVGLANVRARVAAVRGTVECRSAAGQGTDVMLTLPIHTSRGSDPARHQAKPGSSAVPQAS